MLFGHIIGQCHLVMLYGGAAWCYHWVVSFDFAICWAVPHGHVSWQCHFAVWKQNLLKQQQEQPNSSGIDKNGNNQLDEMKTAT